MAFVRAIHTSLSSFVLSFLSKETQEPKHLVHGHGAVHFVTCFQHLLKIIKTLQMFAQFTEQVKFLDVLTNFSDVTIVGIHIFLAVL